MVESRGDEEAAAGPDRRYRAERPCSPVAESGTMATNRALELPFGVV
jgi:hypothetical protein